MRHIRPSVHNKSFIRFALSSLIGVIILAIYIGYLLYYSKNSYYVYVDLNNQKIDLQVSINDMQYINAQLQKKFLELKNLEPE